MKLHVTYAVLLATACLVNAALAATGKDILTKYKNLPEDNGYATRFRYLESLTADEFRNFIQAVVSEPGYDANSEGASMAMAVFAKRFLNGPGKNDEFRNLVSQVTDQSMPAEWRMALMDVAKIAERDLSAADIRFVYDGLEVAIRNANEKSGFRRMATISTIALLQRTRERLALSNHQLAEALNARDSEKLRQLRGNGVPENLADAAIAVLHCEASLSSRLAMQEQDSHDPEMQKFAGMLRTQFGRKHTTKPSTR